MGDRGKKEVDEFNSLAQALSPHPHRAQILLEVVSEGRTLDKAKAILRDAGVKVLEEEVPKKGDFRWVILHISVKDMRESVFKLSEAGFLRVKGVNSLKS